jgi:hypothetical protein
MNTPRIGIIIATTREGRFGDKAAAWTQTIAAARGDMYLELPDLRDYPMPFFNEPTSPLWAKPKSEVALRWAQKVAGMDGFVFVTAEYNHSVPAVLKNSPPLRSIVRQPDRKGLPLLPLLVLTALVLSLAFRAKRAARHSIFTRRATAQQALGQFWDSRIVTLRDIA